MAAASSAMMIFGIVGVMEVDVVAKELAAHWTVAEIVMH
jgi:hypothetical protein